MNTSTKLFLRVYAITLCLYPVAFRERYADELIEAARLQATQSRSSSRLAALFFWDLLQSLPRVHWYYATPKRPFHALAVLLMSGALCLFLVISDQRSSRRAAEYLPATFARQYSDATAAPPCGTYGPGCTKWYARRLAGQHRREIASPSWLNGGLVFISIYDSTGQALGGNATLNGKWPQPPESIFEMIRLHGEARATWEPQPGVRVALVGRSLASGGFVLSGDSLLQSEAAHTRFLRSWLIMTCFIATPILYLAWKRGRVAL
jgi:hypothetical protein